MEIPGQISAEIDNLGVEHSCCFGHEFKFIKDGSSSFAVPSGGDAYQCAT
jgi:hypothetical protein